VLWSRDADEYLLPTERRVIRVRQYWAGVWKELTLTALVRVGNGGAGALPTGQVLVDNVTFYLALVAVARFTVLAHLWWSERIVITDKRLMWDRGASLRRTWA
jgi:hypothetical protein